MNLKLVLALPIRMLELRRKEPRTSQCVALAERPERPQRKVKKVPTRNFREAIGKTIVLIIRVEVLLTLVNGQAVIEHCKSLEL